MNTPKDGTAKDAKGAKKTQCNLVLSGSKVGFLINFNVLHLRDGIKHVVNGL